MAALHTMARAQKDPATPQDFDHSIAPLLVTRCLDCHSGVKPKGGLDLASRRAALAGGKSGPVLVPGKPSESLLWEYIESDKMPPKKPLPPAEKALVKAWIVSGAGWGSDRIDPFRATTEKRAGYDWWALQLVRRPSLPLVQNVRWINNPLDAFVLSKLEAKGLTPSPEAARLVQIRRLSFDLLGLPPVPDDVANYLADTSPNAYAKLVERFLSSPQYGVHWARHWLDVVRFGESNGFEYDEFRPSAWPYRDWVVRAFNQDLPYDAFARLQLAGDVLAPNEPDAIEATGFLVAGPYDTVGQTQQSSAMRQVVRQDELEDMIGTVGQTFLGLTVNCARCHDHKFDPVRQVEYHRLAAALDGVHHGERDLTPLLKEVIDAKLRLAELKTELAVMEEPVRRQILAQSKASPEPVTPPIASWDFRVGYQDRTGNLHGTPHGDVRLVRDGAKIDGATGYIATVPLDRNLKAKTLEVWVQLDNLRQGGGGAISIQSGGTIFDAVVFAEMEAGHWMAGSDNFSRTKSFRGPVEREAGFRPVHFAISYEEDGTITGYRNGRTYGEPYKSAGIRLFKAGESEVVFGLRHGQAGGNRMLAGVIQRAQLYDRALSPVEIAASAGAATDYVSEDEIASRMTPEQSTHRQSLQAEINAQNSRLAVQSRKAYAVCPRQPEIGHLLVRGNPQQLGETVTAAGVAALVGVKAEFGLAPNAPEAERRKRLAAWIAHPRNPLFARVMVNRLWHYHFGTGLVETPNDFGFNGSRPSHPELLDWLASEFVERGWSVKHLQRLIVLSATYRQSSRSNPAAAAIDAGDRLLWRKSPLRLEAEMMRDAMLSVAGQLSLRLNGPGFQDFNVACAPGTTAFLFTPTDSEGEAYNRRTLYRAWARGGRNRLLDAFDCPDPSATTPKRAVTTTPLQALAMFNNSLVLRMADRFAERLKSEMPEDIDRQIRRAYWLAYGRAPKESEAVLAKSAIQKHGLAVLARAIFNSNEFLYVD